VRVCAKNAREMRQGRTRLKQSVRQNAPTAHSKIVRQRRTRAPSAHQPVRRRTELSKSWTGRKGLLQGDARSASAANSVFLLGKTIRNGK
jgi:hypothetical protein